MAGLFDRRAWKRPGLHAHSLQRFARPNGSLATQGFGRDVTMAGLLTARREEAGRDLEPCKLRLCSGWTLPSPSRMRWLRESSRGLAFRMT